MGLSISFAFGLTPPSFPYDNVREQTDACRHGAVTSDGVVYDVHGGPGNSPPRWAVGPDPDRIAYIATIPPSTIALNWARARQPDSTAPLSFTEPPWYALAITNGACRDVFLILDALPGDDQMLSLFQAALDGELPKLTSLHAKTGQAGQCAPSS